jgi:hypothetical protein
MPHMTIERSSSVLKQHDESLSRIFAAYTISATAWLAFATFVGILLAYKFGAPEFGSGEWLTFGRLRPTHTNGTFYGWASIALVGLAYYVAVRSSRTSLYSASLAWLGLWLFNIAALIGTIALFLGYNDGSLEYREWPWRVAKVGARASRKSRLWSTMGPGLSSRASSRIRHGAAISASRSMPSVRTIRSIHAALKRARRSRSGYGCCRFS